jgi:hypothetical protein
MNTHLATSCGFGYGEPFSPLSEHERHYDPDGDVKPLDEFAWPGGYPIAYYSEDGDTFCGRHAWAVIVREDVAMSRDIFYEGPAEWCAEGSHEIPSAYGDPEDPDDDA